MGVTLNLSADQRVLLERLELPDHIVTTLRSPSLALGGEDARIVSDALGLEMARVGFDLDYEPTAEGRLIEDLIDELFIP